MLVVVQRTDDSAAGANRTRRLAALGAPLLACLLVALALVMVVPANAAAGDDSDDGARRLAERHAPVVMIREQEHACDTAGEQFEPAPVEIVLDNPEILLRQVGNGDPVVLAGPGMADIYDLREGWYLDFPGDALDPGCIFEQDFRRFYDGQSVVYAHIATEEGHPDRLALQYWFFWYHNPAKNDHEGDWEFIQLLFDVGTVAEALETVPIAVGYAQHTGGERSAWDDDKFATDGVRPVVFPAVGSHAGYFGQALYLGRSGHEGFGCDNTDGPSRRLDPEVVLLPDRPSGPDDPYAWLAFQGRWGQREAGFFNGPTGPYAKARWTEPVTWHENLRASAVVVPSGDRFGDGVVNSFCDVVEFGSQLLVSSLRSPAILLVALAAIAVATTAYFRGTRWRPVTTAPIREHRAAGQILQGALRVWREHPLAMAWVGLVYIPVAFVTAILQTLVQAVPLVNDVVDLAGDRGGVAFFLAVFVGSIDNLLAFAYVSTVVARTIEMEGWRPHGARLPGAPSIAELGTLLHAVLRAAAIVIVLLVSIIGIPWALRQIVRYQLVPQVVALEGRSASDALRRSSELVRGRWWWTAEVIAALHLVIGFAGFATAMILLVTVTSIPLWLFNVLSAAIFVFLVPVGAAAMTYVYGTLVVRSETDQDADEVRRPAPA